MVYYYCYNGGYAKVQSSGHAGVFQQYLQFVPKSTNKGCALL